MDHLKPYYSDDYATIYHGEASDVLRSLPEVLDFGV